ncbi:MAG: hypothetical protein KDB26_04410 [Microthrixaceae bacterium]|nr:hypothetical protein [Microthrixaceae bacterium]
MNNVEPLKPNFTDASSVRRYLYRLRDVIEPLGFNRSNTFTMASLCRDELTQSLLIELADFWRLPFILGGLAGLPHYDIETWQTGLSHIPESVERSKLLIIGTAHVGMAPDGTIGHIKRRGQNQPTIACGALGAVAQAITNPVDEQAPVDPKIPSSWPTELAVLQETLGVHYAPTVPIDVGEMTFACAQVINTTMHEMLDSLTIHETCDVVVATGVQIHLEDDADQMVPVATTLRDEHGKQTPLSIG